MNAVCDRKKKTFRVLSLLLVLFVANPVTAAKIVNVYVWGGEIPKSVIQQFEHETGIKVNFSTYDSNETMYAKLKASRKTVYDVIQPSGYYVERMKKQGMLDKLNHSKLPNLHYLNPVFAQNDFDEGSQYSVPLIWGLTGIFYNDSWVSVPPLSWSDLWHKRWRNKLIMLDDAREIFSIALMGLGYPPNDSDPEHIRAAYHRLLQLVPNIKLFASESIQAIIIDEDAVAGSVWNGDAYKARKENQHIHFVYPQEGFVIWVDCLAIPTDAPHPEEALAFINFMLRPNIAAKIGLEAGHAITNEQGVGLLPKSIRTNPTIYPPKERLKKGSFQRDVGDKTIALYNHYWELLKLAF